jgi:HlyD family secretion protein
MDVPRQGGRSGRRRQRLVGGALAVAAVATALAALARLDAPVPAVERDSAWIGRVERGEMLRQVRGSGRLVPETVRWIAAETSGVVEEIALVPGARVAPDTLILRLANAEVEQAALEAENALERARAELARQRVELEAERLGREAALAAIRAEHHQARLRAAADEELAAQGLIAQIQADISRSHASALSTRLDVERQRMAMLEQAAAARLDSRQAEVAQSRDRAALRRRQRRSLDVRAGVGGIVQEIPVEEGQQVTPGTSLARVAEPSRLKAVLHVPATQTSGIRTGDPVSVDTRNGMIRGAVRRIDPAVRDGRVLVEVELTGPLPPGARPDLSVQGAVEIEKLEDVLFVERPAHRGEGDESVLFRLEPDGSHAVRRPVRFGRESVHTIEIAGGLAEGDQVILSDTSPFDEHPRIRLE